METTYFDYMSTRSGKHFYPGELHVKDVDLDDIAHALSRQQRFGGHTDTPWSVAEHSIFVMELVLSQGYNAEVALQALLHDAHEAYVTDVPTMLKTAAFRDIEKQAAKTVREALGCPTDLHHSIQAADWDALVLEGRHLFRRKQGWAWGSTLNSQVAEQIWNLTFHTGDPALIARMFKLHYYQLRNRSLGAVEARSVPDPS